MLRQADEASALAWGVIAGNPVSNGGKLVPDQRGYPHLASEPL
jgi:hypothetical protein